MKQKGASLAQYAIVIAIVSVGIIGVYSMLGQQIVKQLNLYLKAFQDNNVKISNNAKIITQNPGGALTKPGQWNGGPGKPPVSKCTNGVCDIDFGDYILSGIPENFNDFTHSNGASGANDKIYSLYMQLANQLETNGDLAGAQGFRDLANVLKFMVDNQKKMEDLAKSCQAKTSPRDCFNDSFQAGSMPISFPVELKNILAEPGPYDTLYFSVSNMFGAASIGSARSILSSDYGSYPYSFPSEAFIAKYDEIINNSKFSNNLKGIAKELFLTVHDINEEVIYKTSAYQTGENLEILRFDPLTGNELSSKIYTTSNISDLINLKIEGNNSITNALKCASQNYQNAQTVCHNQ